jgi:hypothetical protein
LKKINELRVKLNLLIATFESDEILSQFELGQVDALRWIKQTIEEEYGTKNRELQSKKRSATSSVGKSRQVDV